MTPTQAIAERSMVLLGQDSTTLHTTGGAELLVNLFINDIAPSAGMTTVTFTPANFDGYAAKEVLIGDVPESVDPVNGDVLLTFTPSAGGFLWETTGVTHLPETVYGYYVTNNAGTVVYGAKRFASPITLTGVNQSIDLGALPTFRLQNGSIG